MEEKTSCSKPHGCYMGASNLVCQRYTSIIVTHTKSQFKRKISANTHGQNKSSYQSTTTDCGDNQ